MDFLDVLFWVFCLSLLCVFGGLLCVGENKSKKASINWTTEDLPDMVKCLRCGWVDKQINWDTGNMTIFLFVLTVKKKT